MFRDDTLACPTCKAVLAHNQSRLVCQACGGTFVADAELAGMLDELSPDDAGPLARRLAPAAGPVRACPRCGEAMTAHALYGVPVQRCAHGAWFDRGGLERALHGCTQLVAHRAETASRPSPVQLVACGVGAVAGTISGIVFEYWPYTVGGIVFGLAVAVTSLDRKRAR
jgi:Zn-finger nucleic acid-binding protein